MKEKRQNKDKSLELGREFAFGDLTSPKVKILKNEHEITTARNLVTKRSLHESHRTSLPPP